jgi:sterol desaturase/sphingolipid hydroxylase (fatty acid hydroxylase superfamily)
LAHYADHPAGPVLVSPAYHRLHHAPDTQQVNLGVVLTIWDILAGRARPRRPAEPGRAGRRSRASYPRSVLGLVIAVSAI